MPFRSNFETCRKVASFSKTAQTLLRNIKSFSMSNIAARQQATTKPTAATHQPLATETTLEGERNQVKLLDWDPTQNVFYGRFSPV